MYVSSQMQADIIFPVKQLLQGPLPMVGRCGKERVIIIQQAKRGGSLYCTVQSYVCNFVIFMDGSEGSPRIRLLLVRYSTKLAPCGFVRTLLGFSPSQVRRHNLTLSVRSQFTKGSYIGHQFSLTASYPQAR